MKLINLAIRCVLMEEETGGEGSSSSQSPTQTPGRSDHTPSAPEIAAAQGVDDSHLDPVVDFDALVGDDEGGPSPPPLRQTPTGDEPPPASVQTPTPQTPLTQPPIPPTGQTPAQGQSDQLGVPPTTLPEGQQPAVPQQPGRQPEGVVPPPQQLPRSPEQPPQPPQGPTVEELQAQEAALRQHLTQSYTLDEDTLNLFEENPGQVLSTMAANLHMQVMQDITRGMMQALPNVIQNVVEAQQRGKEWEARFYSQWPKLSERRSEAEQVAKMYRQMRPDLSPEAFIQEAGMHAMVLLGLPIENPSQSPPQAQQPPLVPPVQRATPVAPGGSQPQRNVFEELAEDVDD